MPRLRHNPLSDEWIVLSPERARRPEDFIRPMNRPLTPAKDCLFCLDGPAYQEKIYETEHTYVIPNKYPAFVNDPQVVDDGGGLFENGRAMGRHEVIIRKDHHTHLLDLPASLIGELLEVVASRVISAREHSLYEVALPFHNHGPEAGASLFHPHSQLIASDLIPPRLHNMIRQAGTFYASENDCLLCRLWRGEAEQNRRVLCENDGFIALLPYASRYPYEVQVIPKHHASEFERLDAHHFRLLSHLLEKTFAGLKKALNDPPLNWAIMTRPLRPRVQSEAWHWFMEITPRLEHFGGYEVASGAIINTLSPERATEYLRKHM